MKYVYQDSVELPVQQDFIEDMRALLSIAQQIIPLENRAIEINEKLKNAKSALDQTTRTLKQFEDSAIESITTYAKAESNEYLNICKDNIITTIKSSVTSQIAGITTGFESDNKQMIDERTQLESKMKQVLDPVLANAVYNADTTTIFKTADTELEGSISASLNDLSFTYSLKMIGVPAVSDLSTKIEIPVWKIAGLLKKEASMKIIDISDYLISNAEISNNFMMLGLKNKKGTKTVQMLRKGSDAITVWYEDEERIEITKDDALAADLNTDALKGFMEKAKAYLQKDSNIKLRVLDTLDYKSVDAIHENKVFDCLDLIASIYGKIVQESFQRGHGTKEIIIKEIQENGERMEKYISVDEIKNILLKLGDKGSKLCERLGVDASE